MVFCDCDFFYELSFHYAYEIIDMYQAFFLQVTGIYMWLLWHDEINILTDMIFSFAHRTNCDKKNDSYVSLNWAIIASGNGW